MSQIEETKQLIEREPDVKRVLEIQPVGDRFRYLIETPFETFPKFVIGTTDADFEDVRIEIRCGAEWNARRHWGHLQAAIASITSSSSRARLMPRKDRTVRA